MVARLIEGWESSTTNADYAGKWTSVVGGSVSSADGRSGNGLRCSGSTHAASRTFDSQATWIVGFALRISVTFTTTTAVLSLADGATVHCGIGIQASTGQLIAWRGTTATVLGTAAAALVPGVWYYVEGKFTIADAPSGVAVVRVNGTAVIDLTTADTRNSATATANIVRLGSNATLSGTGFALDDVYILDATGGVNTDFLGDCRVEQVLPTGAGATTGWTPSAGSNWQTVDEVPPTADTDYVSSSTAAQTDTYACGDLSVATSGTVKAVQATAHARKDDAGSRSIALVARPGSTDRVGSTQAVGDSYARYAEVWNTNPDTAAAWTVAEVNASEFGVRLIA